MASSPRPKNRDVTSRYKLSPSPVPVARRLPAPHALHKSIGVSDVPSLPLKRSVSAERRSRSRNPFSLSNDAESKVSKSPSREASILADRRRFSASNEVLWPSTRPFSGAFSCDFSALGVSKGSHLCPAIGQSKLKPVVNGKSRYVSDEALKPSVNVVSKTHDSRGKLVLEHKSLSRLSQNRDQSENAQPRAKDHMVEDGDGGQGGRHGIRKSSSGSNSRCSIMRLTGTGAMARSVDLASAREKPLNSNDNSRQSSTSMQSKTSSCRESIPRSLSSSRAHQQPSLDERPVNSAKSRSESRKEHSLNEGPVTPKKTRMSDYSGRIQDSPRRVSKESDRDSLQHVKECCNNSVPLVSSHPSELLVLHSAKGLDLSCNERIRLNYNALDAKNVSSGGITTITTSRSGLSTPGNVVRTRVGGTTMSALDTTGERLLPRLKSSGSPQRSNTFLNGAISSPWSAMSNRSVSSSVPPQQPQSPGRSSPYRNSSSPSKLRGRQQVMQSLTRTSSAAVMLNFGADMRKGKKGLNQLDEIHLHRILHNRLIQWRLVNARSEVAMNAQNFAAEKALYNVYVRIFELRSSVTKKKAKLHQARRARRLNALLSFQSPMLEDWFSLKNEHMVALKGVVEALEAAVLRLPVTGGIRADTLAVKAAMISAFDMMNLVEKSVTCLLPKTEKISSLISELGLIAAQEKVLLEECASLLAMISALEVEERSIEAHFIQCEHEKIRVLGHLMDTSAHIR